MDDKFIVTPNKSESVNITVRMDKAIQEQFDHLARISNRSRNQLINMALRFALERMEFTDADEGL